MDDLLMSQLLAGRPKALRAARKVTRCDHDAEDCVQTALQNAVEQGSAFAPENPAAWLVMVSRRRAVDLVRRKEAQAKAALRTVPGGACPDIAEEVAEFAEARWLAMEARRHLPKSTQAVLSELVRGSTVREAALALGLTERSAEGHLQRARGTLRRVWLAAAGGLAAIAAGLRRLTPVAAAPAVLVVFVLGLQPLTGGTPSQSGHVIGDLPAPSVDWTMPPIRPLAGVTTREGNPAQITVPTRRPTRRVASGSGAQRPVLREQDPTGHTDATVKERGGTDDPVWGTVKCLQEFEVTPSHVGC